MRVEDAMLCLAVDGRGMFPREAAELCREAVAGGVDVIELGPGGGEGLSRETVERVAEACRAEDALLLLRDEPSLVREVGAAGVHLSQTGLAVGYVRTILPSGSLVALSAGSPDEAIVALELEPDLLVYAGGRECPGVFTRLRELSGAMFFAAGIGGPADAYAITARGVYRLWLDVSVLKGSITESAAEFARLVGRCL
jgi:hypothetical protein